MVGMMLLVIPATASASAPCYEDQPCWVWSKDGNRKRGVTVNGTLRTVGPCTYAKLAHAKRLDSTTVRLRGDVWAHWRCDNDRERT
jgi:hypothetical protein